MILRTADLVTSSFSGISTRGASGAARYVAEEFAKGRDQLQNSYSLGLTSKGVFDDLCTIAEECSSADWDGYGAEPVVQDTYQWAYRFLEALPLGIPAPTIGAEPDGDITVEWYRAPHRTLSVSITPEGDLHYAALIGVSKAYGTEPFFGDIPALILDLLGRVTA
jgi:hypothetical protein